MDTLKMKMLFRRIYRRTVTPWISNLFFRELVTHTNNFGSLNWLGNPVWQNVFDLWTIQEVLYEIKPEVLIECGTNRGGSAYFYAQLFDLIGYGSVISVDVEKLHNLEHPRVNFLIGNSVSRSILSEIECVVANSQGPIMVILDSDHSMKHVSLELEHYSPLVTVNSYCLVQDGVIDTLGTFKRARPGPLPAIKRFLQTHPNFTVDKKKSERFLITHHPSGWLLRTA